MGNINDDLQFEGKKKAYLDIDRMINEGMSGGKVFRHGENTNIEEARELGKESPPK